MTGSAPLRAALAEATDDELVLDLAGIAERYESLCRELPGVRVRFAVKACPADAVLAVLAEHGAGFDAASGNEIAQALRAGAPRERIHYGNTVKSDREIAAAFRLGIRDFATDSLQDVRAVAVHAPGSRVFCRLATAGTGALWGLGDKFGCAPAEAVTVLAAARDHGLTPAGLSLHVGSQQMTAQAWASACHDLSATLVQLERRGLRLDHVNLGGGLPAAGYLDRRGQPLVPRTDRLLAAVRSGVQRLREASCAPLDFLLEPGRYLVADSGAIRAHVVRMTTRGSGEQRRWLYLSCGRFNGLYETDQVRYRLEFPTHATGPLVPARVAGPTCDSEDAIAGEHLVPAGLSSGDPVWIHCTGAYSLSYATRGFNGFDPLPWRAIRGDLVGTAADPTTGGPR